MSGSATLSDAAKVSPPELGNNNEVTLGAGAASAEQDLFANEGDDLKHFWISVTATDDFNFICGKVGMADPANKKFFAGKTVQQFRVTRAGTPVMIVIMPVAGDFKWWKSSQ